MRVKIGQDHFDTNTKIYVNESHWSSLVGQMKGNTEDARRINTLLEAFKIKVFDNQRALMIEGKQIDLDLIKHKWFGTEIERPRMLLEIFENHNAQMKALIGQEFAKGTHDRYVISKRHTAEFMKWKYRINDIDIKKLSYEFITDYEFWLRSVRKCDHNTTIKYLANFRKIIGICLKNAWLLRDPFYGFKMSKREVERPILTLEELQTVWNKEFQIERLSVVRDIFVFSCFTAMAYVDVEKFERKEIVVGIDGKKWIHLNRQKTKTLCRIPILPIAQEILDKYKDHPQCLNRDRLLPIMSNQKMNSYLKEIADLCGIEKCLTFHVARHTFATTVALAHGVPIETVSKILGHKDIKTTQHYGKILDKKISDDVAVLRDVFGSKDVLKKKMG